MSAAINSDETETNERIERQVHERQEFGKWWREWADTRACNTTFIREVAFEAWKAARKATIQ
jgi:hypothetical protein